MTPVLRTAAGAEVALPPVTIGPDDITSINLRKAVLSVAPELVDRNGSFGSAVYRFAGMSEGNIFGASMVDRTSSPIGFHFHQEPVEQGWSPASTESVWWLPRATATDYLMVANASMQPLTGSLIVSDIAGRSTQQAIGLAPAETQRFDLRAIVEAAHLAGTEGGVTILVPSGAGNLNASQIVYDETTGMSATMKAFERDATEQPKAHTMRAPMMALANPDPVLLFPDKTMLVPQLFLRNTTAAALKTELALNWRATNQSGSLPLPAIDLAPGATRVLDLMSATRGLPKDAYWATVVLNYQGRSGDLVPIATSFDESGRYGLQTPFSEGVSHLWKGNMWHVDASRNSLITTGNGGTGPTHAAVTLFYNGGKSSYTIEKERAPGEQIWANVGEIIQNQIPDKDGKTIPPDIMMGSYELRDLDHIGVGYLYEGKLVIDKGWGHGYYGCAGCCGYETPRLNPNPQAGAVSTGQNDTAEALDGCTASWQDVTSEAYAWASTNSGIVNVANAYSKFVSPGGVTGSAQVKLQEQMARLNCPVTDFEPQNTQNAQPSITWNGTVINGTTQNAVVGEEISLSGSPGGGTWQIGGNIVGGFQDGASGGPLTLVAKSGTDVLFYWVTGGSETVTYTVSGMSATATFTVVAPTFGSINVTPSTVYLEPPPPPPLRPVLDEPRKLSIRHDARNGFYRQYLSSDRVHRHPAVGADHK